MHFPPLLAVLSFTVLAEAQNFSSYVPDCAPPCVQQTLNSTKLCASLDDNRCLCANLPRLVFPSIQCFTQTCNNSNLNALRSEILSGWTKFCNDSGVPAANPFGPGSPFPGSSWAPTVIPTVIPTVTPTVAPTVTPTVTPTLSPAASSDTGPTSGPGLSTGAKVGIGVGVGIGSLAVIGGLAFLMFRRGRQKEKMANSSEGEYKPPPEAGATATTLAELPSSSGAFSHVELSAHDAGRRELPVAERPVELWHDGPMPAELSADAEIPRRVGSKGVMRS